MAAKKYLSLEEAAAELGVSTKELIELRERQEIRGFADRGTWKFKAEDVEEFGRRRQADSDPDLPMLSDDGSLASELGEQETVIRRSALDEDDVPRVESDSDVRLVVDPDLAPPPSKNLLESDSDVRLIDDAALRRRKQSSSDVKAVGNLKDSDSDVRLSDQSGAQPIPKPLSKGKSQRDSDSDVRLINDPALRRRKGSDSDVKIVGNLADSESDVRLPDESSAKSSPRPSPKGKPQEDSDSDVKLLPSSRMIDTEQDMGVLSLPPGDGSVLSDDNDLVLDDESGLTLRPSSGISLEKLVDSGISLEAGASGISLMGESDSGNLGGSGILLTSDSGKKLGGQPQSGTRSAGPKSGVGKSKSDANDAIRTRAMTKPKAPVEDDSGLTLADAPDSGIALSAGDDMGLVLDDESGIGLATDSGISLEKAADSGISLESGDDLNRTMPMLAAADDLDGTNVEVPMLSDEGSNYELRMPTGDSSADEVADTSVILFDDEPSETEGATRLGKSSFDDEGEAEAFDMEDAGAAEEDLDVAEDVVGEDDELDEMDVFDAGDEDFDSEFDAGESQASFVAPARGAAYEAPPAEWGTGTFVGLLVSTLFMSLCGTVMYDLVRSMWAWNEPTGVTRALLDQIRGMF